MDAAHIGNDLEKVLIDEETLQARLREMAAQVDIDYAGRDVLLVGVLKGAVMVMADLARALTLPVQHGLDGRVAPTARRRSPPAWCGSSRTSTPTSPAGTS